MVTLKLKKPAGGDAPTARTPRAPVRGIGSGVRPRPTQAEAEAYRARRDEARRAEANAPQADHRRASVTVTEAPRRGAAPRPQPRGNARPKPPAGDRASSGVGDARPRSANPFDQPRPGDRPRARGTDPFDKPRADGPPRTRTTDPFDKPRADERPRPRSVEPKPRAAPTGGPYANPMPARRPPREPIETEHADGSMRLSKRMSALGLASRREADEWIARGWVRVDGRVVSELGSRVLPSQHVTVDAKARNQQAERVTVLINKPIGYVSGQAEDGHEPAFVLVKPESQWRADHSGKQFLREHLRSLVPAGRLDIDSTGLLVLTQDGRIAKQLIGEGSEIEKEYLVRVTRVEGSAWRPESLALLRHGLELDGEPLRPAHVEWLNDDQLRFVLTQGKKRQIRRMCEAVGLHVIGLKRVRIGDVMLGDLPVGQWRYLRHDEAFGVIEPARSVRRKSAVTAVAVDPSMQVEVAAEQAQQADDDQVDRDDEVEQPRHRQDEDAGDQ